VVNSLNRVVDSLNRVVDSHSSVVNGHRLAKLSLQRNADLLRASSGAFHRFVDL
jgi:hypothetical protein